MFIRMLKVATQGRLHRLQHQLRHVGGPLCPGGRQGGGRLCRGWRKHVHTGRDHRRGSELFRGGMGLSNLVLIKGLVAASETALDAKVHII